MTPVLFTYDMRAPAFGARPKDIYQCCLDQCEWADRLGLEEIDFTEHHATRDGYLPSPIVMAAAVAGRTRKITIAIKLLLLPLYDPIRVAEDLAVLDLASGGRVQLTIGGGYRPAEYAQFGLDFKQRPRLVEKYIEVLRQAWSGEPFEYQGRTVRILPRPGQPLPITLGGTSVASAKRAARIADYYNPVQNELYDVYLQELKALGKPAPVYRRYQSNSVMFIHVSRDPHRDWERIAPHALHDMNEYAEWMKDSPGVNAFQPVPDAEALRATGSYRVMTPEECVAHAKTVGHLMLRPLMGGLDPALSWQSLRLIESDVLPKL